MNTHRQKHASPKTRITNIDSKSTCSFVLLMFCLLPSVLSTLSVSSLLSVCMFFMFLFLSCLLVIPDLHDDVVAVPCRFRFSTFRNFDDDTMKKMKRMALMNALTMMRKMRTMCSSSCRDRRICVLD